jgi:CRISPR/Cas system-associated exonuclease Cas4 (RecB family)
MQWEESMRNFKEQLQAGQSFRHGISMVPTSGIAGQFYCEQKIEMEYLLGEIETEAKTEGEKLHEQLIQMTKTTRADLVRSIKKEKILVASFPIYARFSGLVVVGVPDAIVFLKGIPAFLIELKTTMGDTSRLWKDQLLQAQIYGLILDEMGFDCSRLKLVVIRIRRQNGFSEEHKERFLHESIRGLLSGLDKTTTSKVDGSTTHIVDYSKQDVVGEFRWAEAYWLSQREPMPTQSIAKCRICEFSDVCPHSLIRAHGQKSLRSFSDGGLGLFPKNESTLSRINASNVFSKV